MKHVEKPISLDDEESLLLDELAELQQLKNLRSRLEAAKRGNGIEFYKPYVDNDGVSPQDAFHTAGTFKHRLWEAGNRSGKSTGGVAEDIAWLMGYRAWYPVGDPKRTAGIPQRPVKGLVIAADWGKVREVFTNDRGEANTLGKIWQLLPHHLVKGFKRNHEGVIEFIELKNGSTLTFDTVKSFKNNPLGAESSDWDFLHVDEPCPEDMYIAHARGLMDRNGKDWFTLTPKTESWIHDKFFPSQHAMLKGFESGTKWAQRTSTDQNTTLSREATEDYFNDLSDEERQCRRDGLPLSLAGLVFKQFRYEQHVMQRVPFGWTDYNDPPLDYTVGYAIDPHPMTPHHVLFFCISPYGQLFFFDEINVHCVIEELAAKIKARMVKQVLVDGKFQLFRRNVHYQVADPYIFNTFPIFNNQGRHMSMADEFYRCGLMLTKASKAREHATLRAQQCLKMPDYLYFSPNLTETLYEITHWSWDLKTGKPIDDRDHAMENFGRILLEEPRWYAPNDAQAVAFTDLEISTTAVDLSLPDFELDI